MNRKHTPGPLYHAPIRGAVPGFPELLKFLVAGREQGWTAATTTEEDARLYAAAPDLLAAAEGVLMCIGLYALDGAYPPANAPELAALRAVIHAARSCTN